MFTPKVTNQRRQPKPISVTALKRLAAKLLTSAFESTTIRSHHAAWTHWLRFTSSVPGVSTSGLPDSTECLILWSSWMHWCGYPASSISTWLGGLGAIYTSFGFDDWNSIRLSKRLQLTLLAIEKERVRLNLPEAPASFYLTIQDVASLLALPFGTLSLFNRQLFCALLVAGFFGLHRLAELTDYDDTALICPWKRIQLSSLDADSHLISEASSFVSYKLRAHKPRQTGKSLTVYIHKQSNAHHPHVDTVGVLKEYIHRRSVTHSLAFDVLFLKDDGSVPTRNWFLGVLSQALGKSVGSKCLRAGGATHMALSGCPASAIQIQGRWSSDTWQLYIREFPALQRALLSKPASISSLITGGLLPLASPKAFHEHSSIVGPV